MWTTGSISLVCLSQRMTTSPVVATSNGVHYWFSFWSSSMIIIIISWVSMLLALPIATSTFSPTLPSPSPPDVALTSFLHSSYYYTNISSTLAMEYHFEEHNSTHLVSPVIRKQCYDSDECGIHQTCLGGWCKCTLGYNMNGTTCRSEICYDSLRCYTIWPNSRCASNHQCVCEDDFEIDHATQTCRYHFMNTLKEPYFYSPFLCFVAVVILLLAIWYFCCRRKRKENGNQTTIIFHKGEFPLFRVSNTVATDHIPTISQSVSNRGNNNTSGGGQSPRVVASYTPFDGGDHIIIDNAVYTRTHSVNQLPTTRAMHVCARCLAYQDSDHHHCPSERYNSVTNADDARFHAMNGSANGHLLGREHSHPLMSMDSFPASPPPPPPPPPPYTPAYTPLSDKLPRIF